MAQCQALVLRTRGSLANTTYYYKISAIDGAGSESALTNEIAGKTAAEPPACDPYFSDNVTHWKQNVRTRRD